MTTRAVTEYLNRVKNVQKYSSQFGEPKHDPGVSSGTTAAANLRAKLKRLTKAQLTFSWSNRKAGFTGCKI